MAPHSSTLAWKIPWTEKPGGLQSMGSLRVGHNWATKLSLFTFRHWGRKWQPTPVFLPGESQRQWAPVFGVTQSRTRLKRLSCNSSSKLHSTHAWQFRSLATGTNSSELPEILQWYRGGFYYSCFCRKEAQWAQIGCLRSRSSYWQHVTCTFMPSDCYYPGWL